MKGDRDTKPRFIDRVVSSLQFRWRDFRWQVVSVEKIFDEIYHSNLWHTAESRSGHGSTIQHTEVVRTELPQLLKELGARSILDIPCGDFNWMKETELPVDIYVGADIVPVIVEINKKRFEDGRRQFFRLDIRTDALPKVDLIFCRDCLVHLRNRDIDQAIQNIRQSGSTYLLTTTYPLRQKNGDIKVAGYWRAVNLEKAPFNFPPPLELIAENQAAGESDFKALGLWRIEDL